MPRKSGRARNRPRPEARHAMSEATAGLADALRPYIEWGMSPADIAAAAGRLIDTLAGNLDHECRQRQFQARREAHDHDETPDPCRGCPINDRCGHRGHGRPGANLGLSPPRGR